MLAVTAGLLPFALPALARYLKYEDGPCRADVIVVLSGDYGGTRSAKGAELLRAGYAPALQLDGAVRIFGRPEAELAAEMAVQQGATWDRVHAWQHTGQSTLAEARLLAKELRNRGVKKFLLVTSDFHTRRASTIVAATPGMPPFCTVAAPTLDYREDWWKGRESSELIVFEWLRTLNTWRELYL